MYRSHFGSRSLCSFVRICLSVDIMALRLSELDAAAKTLGFDSFEFTQKELDKRFRTLALTSHPDKNSHKGATERMKKLSHARDLLLKNKERIWNLEQGSTVEMDGEWAVVYS